MADTATQSRETLLVSEWPHVFIQVFIFQIEGILMCTFACVVQHSERYNTLG